MTLLRLTLYPLLSLCIVTQVMAFSLSGLYEIQLPLPATLADKTLGSKIATSGSVAAVAASSSNKDQPGAVYLYDADENWRLTTQLRSDKVADNFAHAIVLAGDRLIVSADRDNSQGINSGAVYIFERDSAGNPHHWRQSAKLTAPDAQAGDQFGNAIALVNDVLYVGAPLRDQGKVYIFTRNSKSGEWQVSDSIEPEDPQALRFGTAIAQDGQNLIIGAPYTNADNSKAAESKIRQPRFAISKNDTFDPGIESGAIFIYQKKAGQWLPTARLGAENRESAEHLGEDIAIEGDIIAASVKQKDVFDDLRAGAVYVYKKVANDWLEDTALIASVPNVGANFGNSFSLKNQKILVGANKIHANGFNSGLTYLFSRDSQNSWELVHQQENATLKAHDQLGFSVSLGEEHMLIASKHAVYAFQNTPIQYYPAIFYPESHTLQLNEVGLNGVGVLSATLHLSDAENERLLTLTDYHFRTDTDSSDINYSVNSGRLTIPRLAIPTSTGEIVFYSVVLQQVESPTSIQFRVLSFNL